MDFPFDFGNYRLLEEVGSGGMGLVYRAVHKDLGRTVALKLLRSDSLADPQQAKMFRREIEATASLQHPNIVAIHEFGVVDNKPFFTMDCIDGCTLAELLGEGRETGSDSSTIGELVTLIMSRKKIAVAGAPGRRYHYALPHSQALAIMMKVTRAVEHAHDRGIIHRDLKPSNILITRTGEPMVMDFGLARHIDAPSDVTLTGQIMGTPAYMSPEQAEGLRHEIGERSDIYSLGAMFYEMLTGRPPFLDTANIGDMLHKIAHEDPTNVRRINPRVPRELETICEKAMDKRPERRYRTAGAFASDIQRYIDGEPILARPPSLLYTVRKKILKHRTVAVLATLLAISSTALAAYWWLSTAQIRGERQRSRETGEKLKEEQRRAMSRWILAFEDDFNREKLGEGWVYKANPTGTAAIEDNMLVFKGHGVQAYGRQPVYGNIRMEFDAIAGEGGEINVLLCCDSLIRRMGRYYSMSWDWGSVKIDKGWMRGNAEVLLNKPVSLLKPGKLIHVIAEKEDYRLRLVADGVTIADADLLLPYEEKSNAYWGLVLMIDIPGRVTFDNLRVYRQQYAEMVNVTGIGDALYNRGLYADALEFYEQLTVSTGACPAAAIALRSAGAGILNRERYVDAERYYVRIGQGRYNTLLEPGVKDVILGALKQSALQGRVRQVNDSGIVTVMRLVAEDKSRGGQTLVRQICLDHLVNPRTLAEEVQGNAEEFEVFLGKEGFYTLCRSLAVSFSARGQAKHAIEMVRLAETAGPAVSLHARILHGATPCAPAPKGMVALAGGVFIDRRGNAAYVEPFWIDSQPVTQQQYFEATGANPSHFNGSRTEYPPGDYGVDLTRPVANLTWYDALLYCNRRRIAQGLDTCYSYDQAYSAQARAGGLKCSLITGLRFEPGKNGFRLPLEDEWEYAWIQERMRPLFSEWCWDVFAQHKADGRVGYCNSSGPGGRVTLGSENRSLDRPAHPVYHRVDVSPDAGLFYIKIVGVRCARNCP